MTHNNFLKTAQTIYNSFPNEQVWSQGGFQPNHQLQTPEAGYCVVFRYKESITGTISNFMGEIHNVLPQLVENNKQNLHTTIGSYGKSDMKVFIPDYAVLQRLAESIEKGIRGYAQNNCIEFGKWLYNKEAIVVPGYPNEDLWYLCQNIGKVCQKNGFPLAMGRILHITTARFTENVPLQTFEKFRLLLKSAPVLGTTKPVAIDLATWSCDGLIFKLNTHKRYTL